MQLAHSKFLPSKRITARTSNNKISTILLSLFLLVSTNSHASSLVDVGPTVGEKAPEISVLNNQKQSVDIEKLSGDKGLVILFFRSADWCPFCKKHLIELNAQANQFTQLGYGLAGISYDNVDVLTQFAQQQSISYPLLSDQNVATMKAYNIVNTQYSPGDDNYGIPYPGVVVIDNKGKVVHKYFFKGYKNRADFSALLVQLRSK